FIPKAHLKVALRITGQQILEEVGADLDRGPAQSGMSGQAHRRVPPHKLTAVMSQLLLDGKVDGACVVALDGDQGPVRPPPSRKRRDPFGIEVHCSPPGRNPALLPSLKSAY